MLYLKKTNAISLIYDLIKEEEIIWEEVSDLVKTILNNDCEDSFDNYFTSLFPCGISKDSFINIILNKTHDIYDYLNLKKSDNK